MKVVRSLAMLFGLIWLAGPISAPAQSGPSGDNLDRWVVVINHSSYVIREFYASNVDVQGWQEDILGRRVLEPGQRIRINIDDGTGHCYYDFKAVFADGTHTIRRRVNVCVMETWTITN